MFNRYKKMYLLSGLFTFILVMSTNLQEIYAKGETPTLKISESTGTPVLEWKTKMLEEDIIFKTGFEENDSSTVSLTSHGLTNSNLHSLTPLAAFNGNRGYLLNNNRGKSQYPRVNTSDGHIIELKDKLYIPNGTHLTASFKAKSIGNSYIFLGGEGGFGEEIITIPAKAVKNHAVGERKIYLDSLEGVDEGKFVTLDTDAKVNEYIYWITNIDTTNKTITLNKNIQVPIANGEHIKQIEYVDPLELFYDDIIDTDWTTYTMDDYIAITDFYDTSVRGFEFYFYLETDGQLMIDDVQLGYATEVEVFREGVSVYKGYDSSFEDESIKDILKLNRPTSVYGYYDENNKSISLNIDKSKGDGVKTYYQIQSIARDGSKSELSPKQYITITSDIKKYKYAISNSSIVPDLTNETASDLLNIPANGIDIENDYIHIQAIDNDGNVSEISTFKLSDIMGSNNNSSKYQQDVLLRLLKGDFALLVRDTISFGPVRLTASKQTISVSLGSNIDVIDARGTQQGWKLNVSATPFTEDTFDGFKGTPVQLPLGTLSLGSVKTINQVADIDNVIYPSDIGTNTNIIDSGEVTLLQANVGEGMGQFELGFGEDALSIVVDSSTARIDDVNYPTGMTPYTSTITWNLVTGP